MSDIEPVLYDAHDGVARVTLNRPGALNALTPAVMHGLRTAFARVREDRSVRVVVLSGAGRGFCSGADLGDVASGERAAPAAEGTTSDAENLYNNAVRDRQLPRTDHRAHQWRSRRRRIRSRSRL